MRQLTMAGLALLASACAETGGEVTKAPETLPTNLTQPGCYTVDLFREVPINEPAAGVPPEHAAFLGEWGNGVWGGTWCHDLLIHTVHADGRAEMLDMHAPTEIYNAPASVFKRIGQIGEDGALRFSHDVTSRTYRIVDGKLRGLRDGGFGPLEIVMTRKGVVPEPRPRPVRVARAAVTPTE